MAKIISKQFMHEDRHNQFKDLRLYDKKYIQRTYIQPLTFSLTAFKSGSSVSGMGCNLSIST